MAMEIFALSDRRLTSMAEWQRAIDIERFPFPLTLSVNTPFASCMDFYLYDTKKHKPVSNVITGILSQ